MSDTTLRYYDTTLAYNSVLPQRKIRNFRKKIRTRISRRRFKQTVQNTIHHLSFN